MDQKNTWLLQLTITYLLLTAFMKSDLNKLVKKLIHIDFQYLSPQFSIDFLDLVKKKGVYPYQYMNSFENFFKNKVPDRCEFFSSLKN